MKRLFFIFAAVVMTVSMMAEGHIKFKGVEINGTKEQIIAQLGKQGCEVYYDIIGTCIKADFAGLEMYVALLTTSQSKTVYAIVASTLSISERASFIAQYNTLKQLLDNKYGMGKDVVLEDGYYASSRYSIDRGNADKAVLYDALNGTILLYVHGDRVRNGNIVVEYIDNANKALKDKEANDDI